LEKTLIVAIEQEGIVKTAISGINETIDNISNHGVFSIAKWSH
jgi:hypothetical protein